MNDSKLLDMCKTTKWDGIDRVSKFAEIFDAIPGTEEDGMKNAVKWFIQCCAAWDGNKHIKIKPTHNRFPYILLLIGVDPKTATRVFEMILPKGFSDYQTSIEFNPKDKYSIVDSIDYSMSILTGFDLSHGFVEAKDYVEFLNIFLYRTHDRFRRGFGSFWKTAKRKTCFAGTVESPKSLVGVTSDTHNFLPIYLVDIDFEKLEQMDKRQLWAQFWRMYVS